MTSLETAEDETSVPLSLRDPTSYVLCYGMQHDAEATRQQHEAYMAVVHKIIQREDAARALLLSVNVLSTSVISSQLTMYRWKVTEVRTVAQATATLLDEIMDASRKGYRVERTRAKAMGVSRFADGQGLQELYERKMRKIARHRERRARRLQARNAGRAAGKVSPGHPFAATLPNNNTNNSSSTPSDKRGESTPPTTTNTTIGGANSQSNAAATVDNDSLGNISSDSDSSTSSDAEGTSRTASRRGLASNASGRGMAHFTSAVTPSPPPPARSASLCSAEEEDNDKEGNGAGKSKNAKEAAARRRPPPDALTRLVIVDSYTHEPLEDIIQHIRYIDHEYGLELIVVLLLPGRQEAAAAQGAGVVLFPQHDSMTIAAAYAAGYDLVLPHCFDHVAASFFTEMFLSSAGRWRNDVRAKAAVGNYVSLKNILLGNVDLDTLRQLARNGNAGDGVDEAQLLETLGRHSLALQGETKRYSVAMQHLTEEQRRGGANILVLDAEDDVNGTGSVEGRTTMMMMNDTSANGLLPSALARFPRHAMPRNGVRCVEHVTAAPLQHLSAQADMLDTYMNPTSENKHAVRRLRRGPNGQPLRSTTTTTGDDSSRLEDEEGAYEYVMVDENEEHRAALTAAFEKELGRLIAENDEKNAELAYMQSEMDKLQRTVTVLKRMQNIHYGNGSGINGDDDANSYNNSSLFNNGDLDGRNALFDLFEQAQQMQQSSPQGAQDSGIGGSLVNLTKEQQIYILKERLEAANERLTSLLAEEQRGTSGSGGNRQRGNSPQSHGSLGSPGPHRLLRRSFLSSTTAANTVNGKGRGANRPSLAGGLHGLLLQLRRGGRRQLERHEQLAMQALDMDAAAWEGMNFGASLNDDPLDDDNEGKSGTNNRKNKKDRAAEMLRRRRQADAAARVREQEQTDSLISALQDQLAELRGASASGTYYGGSSTGSHHTSASRSRSRRRRHGRRLGSSHGEDGEGNDFASSSRGATTIRVPSGGHGSETEGNIDIGALDLNGLRARLEEAVERLTAQRQRIQQLEEARQIDTTVFTTQLRRLQLQLEGRASLSSNTTTHTTSTSQATSKKGGAGGGGGKKGTGRGRGNATSTRTGGAAGRNAGAASRSPRKSNTTSVSTTLSMAEHTKAMDELRAQLTEEAEVQRVAALRAQAREHEKTMLRCERTVRRELTKLFLKFTRPADNAAYVAVLRADQETAAQGMNEVVRRLNYLLESAGMKVQDGGVGENELEMAETNAAAERGWRAQRQDAALRDRVTALAREYAVYALRAERARHSLKQTLNNNNNNNSESAEETNTTRSTQVTLAEALTQRQRCQATLHTAQYEGDSVADYVQAMVEFVKAEEDVVKAAGPDLTGALFTTQQQVTSTPRTLALPLKDLVVVSDTEKTQGKTSDGITSEKDTNAINQLVPMENDSTVIVWPDADNLLEPLLNIYNAIVQANLRIRRHKPRLRQVTLSPTSSQASEAATPARKRGKPARSPTSEDSEEAGAAKALAERERTTRQELLTSFEHHSGVLPQLQSAAVSATQRQLYQAALIQYQHGHLHPDRMMDIEQQATQGSALTTNAIVNKSSMRSEDATSHTAQAELAGLYLAHHQELLLLLRHLGERYPMLHELTQAYGREDITSALKQEWSGTTTNTSTNSTQATSVPFLVTIDTALLTCAIDCLRAAASVSGGEDNVAVQNERSEAGQEGADFFLTASPKYRPHTGQHWHSNENAYEDDKGAGAASNTSVTIVPNGAATEAVEEEDRVLRHLPQQHTLVQQYRRLLTGDVRRSTAARRTRRTKSSNASERDDTSAPLQLLKADKTSSTQQQRRRRKRRSDEAAMEGKGLLGLVLSASDDEEESDEEDSVLDIYESETSSESGSAAGRTRMSREADAAYASRTEGDGVAHRVLGALRQSHARGISDTKPVSRIRGARRSNTTNHDEDDPEAYLFSGLESNEAGYFAEDIAALFSQKHYGAQPVSISPEEFYLEQAFEDEAQKCSSSEQLLQARSIRDELNYLAELRQARLAELRAHITAMRAARLRKAEAEANAESDEADAILKALQGGANGEEEGPPVGADAAGEFEVKSGSPAWYGMEAAKRVKDILRRRTKPDQIILGGGPNGGDVGIELSRRTAFPLPPPREMEVMQSAQERLRAAHAALPPVNVRGLTRWQRRRRQMYTNTSSSNNTAEYLLNGLAGPYIAPRDAMSLNAYDSVVDTFAFDGAGRFYDAPTALLRRLQSYQDILTQAASRISAHDSDVTRRLGPPFTLPLRVGGLQPQATTTTTTNSPAPSAARSPSQRTPLPNTTSVIYGLPVERVEEMLHTAEEKPDTVLFLPPRPCSSTRLASRNTRPTSNAMSAYGSRAFSSGGMNEFYAAYNGQSRSVRDEFSSPAALAAQRLTALLHISMQDATIGALHGHALHIHPRNAQRAAMTGTQTGQLNSGTTRIRNSTVTNGSTTLPDNMVSRTSDARHSISQANASASRSTSHTSEAASKETSRTASPPVMNVPHVEVQAAVVRNDVQQHEEQEEVDEEDVGSGPLSVRFDRTLPPTG